MRYRLRNLILKNQVTSHYDMKRFKIVGVTHKKTLVNTMLLRVFVSKIKNNFKKNIIFSLHCLIRYNIFRKLKKELKR